jgi:hypothetical protein
MLHISVQLIHFETLHSLRWPLPHPSLIFASKAGAHPSGSFHGIYYKEIALTINIRLDLKCLPVTNALAYSASVSITITIKSLIIDLFHNTSFSLQLLLGIIKLECLYRECLFSLELYITLAYWDH